jgi:hypothetical protein
MKNLLFISLSLLVLSCTQSEQIEPNKRTLDKSFGSYWYSGQAEITAYTLEQNQYGAPRRGDAVLIYVTEDFNPINQVKAERRSKKTVSVLKLNATKRFYTGIYPYNIMQSTFSPLNTQEHALKTSVSIQEWCGHVYAQINNREELEYSSHSYFENEADQQIRLPKVYMENDLWNLIRINPLELPKGNFKAIPSLESIKLMHLDKQVFEASASLHEEKESYHYTLHYPEIDRSLTVRFDQTFPFKIQSWKEIVNKQGLTYVTKAHSPRHVKLDYWNKNKNTDTQYRDSLHIR